MYLEQSSCLLEDLELFYSGLVSNLALFSFDNNAIEFICKNNGMYSSARLTVDVITS